MPTSAISDYMRAMQRKSAASRWAGKSAEERSAEMRRLRARAKAKKRKSKGPNAAGQTPAARKDG